MSLPKIDIPIYETELPLTKLVVKYRPLLVKEEKIILIATQSDDQNEIRQAVEQILTNCILTENFNFSKMPLADIQYLIIQIRDKSLGGEQTLEYSCNNQINDKICSEKFKLKIDFSKLEIKQGDLTKNKVQINSKIGLKLKPPSFSIIRKASSTDDFFDYDILADVVEFVYDEKSTYKMNEQTKEEIEEFFNNLPKKKLDEIYEYIENMPRYEINLNHTCKTCNFEHKITVGDLENFFQ